MLIYDKYVFLYIYSSLLISVRISIKKIIIDIITTIHQITLYHCHFSFAPFIRARLDDAHADRTGPVIQEAGIITDPAGCPIL
jgi:hypothetical protein